MSDEGRFQVAVGAVIRNSANGKILLIHRAPSQYGGGIWEFPIGRIKQFESFMDGLKREVAEETGLTVLTIERPLSVFEFMRGEHAADNEVRAVTFAASTSQEEIKLSEEHDSYQWLSIDEAISLVDHAGIKHDLKTFRDIYANQ